MILIANNRQALVVAGMVAKYRSIRESTYGIVFFSTPHQGDQSVPLGKIASKIARAAMPDPKSSFLDAFQKDSLFADTIIEESRSQLQNYKVISFCESRPLPQIGIVGRDGKLTATRSYLLADC